MKKNQLYTEILESEEMNWEEIDKNQLHNRESDRTQHFTIGYILF